MNDHTLTTVQAAIRLGLDINTIQIWCRRGRLAGAYKKYNSDRLGWRIPESTIRALEEQRDGVRSPALSR